MIKNRFVHLFARVAILCVMLTATILSIGVETFNPNFYVYYTNLSNYFCMIVVFAEIIGTIVRLNRGDLRGNEDIDAGIKFAALIDILVTFLIYNCMLSNFISIEYWSNPSNVLRHFVCPLLFWLDWILFAKHGNTRWFYPLEVVVFPIIYVGYILIRGFVLEQIGSAAWQIIYPYPFLDVSELGYNGVGLWIFALCGAFVAFSYLICIIDNIPNYKRLAQERKLRKIARKQAKENYKKEKIETKHAKKQAAIEAKKTHKQEIENEKQAKIDAYKAEYAAALKAKEDAKQARIDAEKQAKIDAKQAKIDAKQAKKNKKHKKSSDAENKSNEVKQDEQPDHSDDTETSK